VPILLAKRVQSTSWKKNRIDLSALLPLADARHEYRRAKGSH
jgi:hypothetical protein